MPTRTKAEPEYTTKITVKGVDVFYNDPTHKYWRMDGSKRIFIPSVTTFTGIIDKSGPLLWWAGSLCKDYLLALNEITHGDVEAAVRLYDREKRSAGDVGTLVHAMAEASIKGQSIPKTDDPKALSGFQAFKKFERDYQVEWIESEKMLYSPWFDYAGTLDAVGLINGETVLIDFKTSNRLYPEYAVQTAAYQSAYTEMTDKDLDYRMLVRFDKESGEYEVRECRSNHEDFDAFEACLILKRRLGGLEKEWGRECFSS